MRKRERKGDWEGEGRKGGEKEREKRERKREERERKKRKRKDTRSTRSLSRMTSMERGNCPAGAFSGISWMVIV